MSTNQSSTAGWALVLSTLVLLWTLGELDLLVIVLPISLMLSYGMARFNRKDTALSAELKKG